MIAVEVEGIGGIDAHAGHTVGRAGLCVRVTQVQPGRWKERRVTIRARPGRLSALSESRVIRPERIESCQTFVR